jgi:hypothetical protein
MDRARIRHFLSRWGSPGLQGYARLRAANKITRADGRHALFDMGPVLSPGAGPRALVLESTHGVPHGHPPARNRGLRRAGQSTPARRFFFSCAPSLRQQAARDVANRFECVAHVQMDHIARSKSCLRVQSESSLV